MLITANQIRAARALKNWSQTDLAGRTGLAVPTIANIELGKQMPGKNTIEKIIGAFSIGGIKFTPNGVEFDQDDIVTIVGDDKFVDILFDATTILENKSAKERDFLVFNANEELTTPEEDVIYASMKAKGISMKQIINEKAKALPRQYAQTCAIPSKYFDDKGAVFVYDDKVLLYTVADQLSDATTHIITNHRMAEVFKKIFSYMWDNLPEVKSDDKKKGRK
ncbi:MAG: hypothetical protein DI551_04750 [Micavibrio aeruginosavorus]|uniref:HTH cro/C1-type domain-containing protein n=1 Tax=Micavibrio aeruginosavorus TaxID=349221 RepID=A0A2W5MZC1_9BACT|nr:MAG: hypothetical protein DI551_04750 [Micavibrio aeruginosavorus]